ncbi:MAG TPA: hypothetical protein VK388_10400 [Pyrinomonadaceae bacterium]|nr:hypothetical protein [Pyrinomonadaceae bacterium]
MKAEFDKEIDSLLRRESALRGRAASGETAARADGGVPAGAHLDADEQSAYAENALPAPARAYYTAHLTDCDDCRRGVTRLALAAGMPAQLEARETAAGQMVSPGITWRERFGALLAPRAWRYVVPALALLLVSAVSLIVLTRRAQREGGETSIAQRNPANTQRAQTAQQPETHHAPQNGNAVSADAPGVGSVSPDTNAPQGREEVAANNPPGESTQPSTVAPLNDAAAPPPPAPATGSGVGARAVSELPTLAATPAPVADEVTITSDPVMITSNQEAKVKSGESAPELQKLEQKPGNFENRQYENRPREQVSGPRRNERARNTGRDDSRDRADNRDGNVAAATAAPAPPAAATAKRSRQREAERDRDENLPAEDSERGAAMRAGSVAETRTVAGRKFRRQGSAWVDTAYNAGQSYTVVRRNSEQFRALVADEPELRRVAGTLGGEVTVVWKGRAYRIR